MYRMRKSKIKRRDREKCLTYQEIVGKCVISLSIYIFIKILGKASSVFQLFHEVYHLILYPRNLTVL